MKRLQVLAGREARVRILDGGLRPTDVSAVIGASGAAKWLTISGLDRAIFGQWLTDSDRTIELFGTSIGAFKLAAAAQDDAVAALDRLTEAYVDQHYSGTITPEVVSVETRRILAILLPPGTPAEILANPTYRFSCGAVKCFDGLGSAVPRAQKMAMGKAFIKSALGREAFRGVLERVVFADPRSTTAVGSGDGYPTRRVDLTTDNFGAALEASGSIPVLMNGVEGIEGSDGVHRDGGLLDYHPVPDNFWPRADGLVLYPHFYGYLKARWFDKFFSWRRVSGESLENVVLVAPSAEYVRSLPGERIPTKEDFSRFANDDAERVSRWNVAVERSAELGEEFLELVATGRIRDRVVAMGDHRE